MKPLINSSAIGYIKFLLHSFDDYANPVRKFTTIYSKKKKHTKLLYTSAQTHTETFHWTYTQKKLAKNYNSSQNFSMLQSNKIEIRQWMHVFGHFTLCMNSFIFIVADACSGCIFIEFYRLGNELRKFDWERERELSKRKRRMGWERASVVNEHLKKSLKAFCLQNGQADPHSHTCTPYMSVHCTPTRSLSILISRCCFFTPNSQTSVFLEYVSSGNQSISATFTRFSSFSL